MSRARIEALVQERQVLRQAETLLLHRTTSSFAADARRAIGAVIAEIGCEIDNEPRD